MFVLPIGEYINMMNTTDYGDITLADIASDVGGDMSEGQPMESAESENMELETPNPMEQLEKMDMQSIVDYLIAKKVLPDDFQMPKGLEMKPEMDTATAATDQFGDVSFADLMGNPAPTVT